MRRSPASSIPSVSRPVRVIAHGALVGLMLVSLLEACATWRDSRAETRQTTAIADARFPHGYTTAPDWKKLTTKGPLYRPDVSVARDLYGRITPSLGPGTILLKEEYRFENGLPDKMSVIGVMRRTTDPAHARTGGWSFESYDPVTFHRLEEDTAACIGCHALQRDTDWRFAVGHTLTP